MALETQYIVGRDAAYEFPTIFRVILVDGAEVSRGEATFTEVEAAYPEIVELYFNDIAAWSRDLSAYLDQQTEFTAEVYLAAQKAWRFFGYFTEKFDYMKVYESNNLPHLQEPEPVVEETPVEETPVEETPVTE